MRLACSSNKQLGPMVETVFHMIAGRENSGGEGYGVCARVVVGQAEGGWVR